VVLNEHYISHVTLYMRVERRPPESTARAQNLKFIRDLSVTGILARMKKAEEIPWKWCMICGLSVIRGSLSQQVRARGKPFICQNNFDHRIVNLKYLLTKLKRGTTRRRITVTAPKSSV
jgi:hypothetical protein